MTAVSTATATEMRPRFKARVAGIFYLLTIVTGIFAEVFVRDRLLETGNAAVTASNILAHQTLFRLGFAAEVLMIVCYLVVTALFYYLFKPVSRTLSLTAAFFSLLGCAMWAFSSLFDFAPLTVLGGPSYLNVFSVDQLQALALLFLRWGGQASNIALVFFGFYCLTIGYLIFKSTFLPRVIGVLMMLAGLGNLTFLSPPFANSLMPYNLLPSLIGEGSLMICLIVMGVNSQRWHELDQRAVQS